MCNRSPILSPCNSCTIWGSRGLVRELTVIDPAPPANSITHMTVLKYADTVELADTCKQMVTVVSCSLGEAHTFLCHLQGSMLSVHPLGCLVLLALAPLPLPPLAAFPPSHRPVPLPGKLFLSLPSALSSGTSLDPVTQLAPILLPAGCIAVTNYPFL